MEEKLKKMQMSKYSEEEKQKIRKHMKKYWKVQTMRSEENNKLNRTEVDVVTKFIKDEVESYCSDHNDYDYISEDFEWCFFVCLLQNKS